MTKERILSVFEDINVMYNNPNMYDTLKRMLDELTENESDGKKCCDVCFYSDEGQASPSVRMMGCKRRVSYEMKKGYERGFMEGQKNPLFGEILELKEGEEGEA